MMKNRRSYKRISHMLVAGLFGLGGVAHAQQFTLQNNQLTISGGSGTTFSSQSPTISSTGVVSTISNVPSTNGVGIPSFSFTLVPAGGVDDGTYTFRVGIVIDDVANDRRMEAKIETLQLTVGGTGTTLTGTIPVATNPNGLRLLGRNGSNVLQVAINVANAQQSGPISISGGTVSFSATDLISRIRSSHNLFDTIILKEFEQAATYTYRIAVQQTGGPETVNFGTTASAVFTALPKVGVDVTANSAFLLGDPTANELASGFGNAWTVTGQFNVVFIASGGGGGGGGGGTTPTVTTPVTGTTELTNTVNNLTNQIPTTGAIPATVVTEINNAISSSSTLSQNAASQASTLTTTAALTTLTSINSTLALAGTATQRGSTVDTAAAATTITNIASAISAMTTSRTFTSGEVAQINTLAVNTLSSATNLVTTGASTSSILAIVQASSSILAQASSASGAVVSDAVVTQVKELAAKAVTGVINNLPASATAGVNLNDAAAVQSLMRSNPAVLEVALTASAALPANASITIGGVAFTREQLIAASLGGGTVNPIQGGLNFLAATAGAFTVTTDSVSGNMIISTTTEKYIAASPASRLVPASVPNGINYLPDGTAVLVGNGVATELAPTAFDSAGFRTAVTSAGYQLTYRDNGTLSIALGNNERFSGAFGFDNLGSAASCGAISITTPTGNPATTDYAFVVNCANGPKQRVTPIADNEAFYTTISKAGLNASTDRNTGVVTINTVGKFKPSFFVTPLTVSDQTFFNANKNADGVALRAKDANGDGRVDYEIISSTGVQLFYGMP